MVPVSMGILVVLFLIFVKLDGIEDQAKRIADALESKKTKQDPKEQKDEDANDDVM